MPVVDRLVLQNRVEDERARPEAGPERLGDRLGGDAPGVAIGVEEAGERRLERHVVAVETDAERAQLLLVEPRPCRDTGDGLLGDDRAPRARRAGTAGTFAASGDGGASGRAPGRRGGARRRRPAPRPTRAAKKRSCVSSAGRLLPQARDERAACGVGHVGREDEVRVGQRPDDRGLDPLVLGDRLGEARRRRASATLPWYRSRKAAASTSACADDRVDARVVDSLEEIGQVPRDLFRPGDLGRRHRRESSCRAEAVGSRVGSAGRAAAVARTRFWTRPKPPPTRGAPTVARTSVTSPCRVRASSVTSPGDHGRVAGRDERPEPEPTSSAQRLRRRELLRSRRGRAAREPLADVHRSAARRRAPSPRAAGRPRTGRRRRRCPGRTAPSAARATSERTSPTIASSRGGARWRSSAQSAQENARGTRSIAGASRRRTPSPRSISASSPQIRPRRTRTRRHHRVPGRDRIVVEVLRPRGERLAVVRREEEAAALVVGEELDRDVGDPARLEQPADVAGRDVELEQPVGDVRVVVEEAAAADAAVADAPQHAAVLAAQRPEQEVAEPLCGGRASRRARAAGPPRRARRARARSRTRSPCRRETAAAAPSGGRAAAPSSRRRARRARSIGRARTARAAPRRARAPPTRPASRCTSAPRRRRCRRPAPRRSRRSRAASRAAGSRPSPRRPCGSAPRPSRPRRGGTPRRAARCRRASSRSAGRPTARRPSSGGSRRRRRRRGRRPPSRRACVAPCRAPRRPRAAAGARSPDEGGNFGATPNPPKAGS